MNSKGLIGKANRGQKKHEVSFFYGKRASFKWDPDIWVWKNATQIMYYTSKIGRNLLNHSLIKPVAPNKWQGFLLDSYQLKWACILGQRKSWKEAAFICFIWHHAMAVNEWCAKILVNISTQCAYCLPFPKLTLKHRFWDFIQGQCTWRWTLQILLELSGTRQLLFHKFN